MRFGRLMWTAMLVCTGCGLGPGQDVARERREAGLAENQSLAEARQGFQTRLGPPLPSEGPPEPPPPEVFELTTYSSPVGPLSAYVTPDPGDGTKHPAIVWITGGDCNSIGNVWDAAPRENDQTAASYREAGIVMMFPSLRGGNDNPGQREGFLGEVDDVIAAGEYLASLPYVDPDRIYLGGHSTGGTLVMLVAEMSDRFRAVFAFGPVEDVRYYGGDYVYHASDAPIESVIRSPMYWLSSVKVPLFVIEGEAGNASSVRAMQGASENPNIRFLVVPGHDHFSVLAPLNEQLARKVREDTSPACQIRLTEEEVASLQ